MTPAKHSAKIELDDTRRLTGPNLFWDKPGAIVDVIVTELDPEILVQCWQKHVNTLFVLLGWDHQHTTHRIKGNFISLVLSASIDVLYAATEVNETAVEMTRRELLNLDSIDLEFAKQRLLKEISKEQNPKLLALSEAAKQKGICFLSDDDEVSLGYGPTTLVFPLDEIPDVEQIDWSGIECIPLALITGTNGKSTTVRLAASVAKAAGLSAGVTSTDYIRVGDEILDTGDYSGPGGARTLLRHPKTELALLEVARGGMLRRGLGVNQANAAVITNVAEDHLGEYGIENLEDMVEAKFIVRRALNPDQNLILNADDDGCVQFAENIENTIVWFSLDCNHPVITKHLSHGGSACYMQDHSIIYQSKEHKTQIIDVKDIPITMGGAARHNIHNSLAVVALSLSLKLPVDAIRDGLTGFASSPENNPGRGNYFQKDEIRVIVDFAHNSHGVQTMVNTIKNLPSQRTLVLIGQAGDRSDSLIDSYVSTALQANPDTLVICEIERYLRGRNKGEVPAVIREVALKNGLNDDQIIPSDSPLEGTKQSIQWAQNGDTLLLLILSQRDEVIKYLLDAGFESH